MRAADDVIACAGLSANPLMGWIARRLVALNGAVILAETDELIGAEDYVLDKVKDAATANQFLALIDRYYRYTRRFGHSPEGNPSGGNLFRGLYNITLKSAGAAMKKPPDVSIFLPLFAPPPMGSGIWSLIGADH